MAGSLLVRNVDEALIVRLRQRAMRYGRSIEAEHREILRHTLSAEIDPTFDDLAAKLRQLTDDRKQTPSEIVQREDAMSDEAAAGD